MKFAIFIGVPLVTAVSTIEGAWEIAWKSIVAFLLLAMALIVIRDEHRARKHSAVTWLRHVRKIGGDE